MLGWRRARDSMELSIEPEVADLAAALEAAPSNGSTIRDILDGIPNARRLVVTAAFRCLGARKWYFEKGNPEKLFEPDYRTQLDAAKLLMAYMDGLPAQTTLNLNVNKTQEATDPEALAAALESSPALRARLAAELQPPKAKRPKHLT